MRQSGEYVLYRKAGQSHPQDHSLQGRDHRLRSRCEPQSGCRGGSDQWSIDERRISCRPGTDLPARIRRRAKMSRAAINMSTALICTNGADFTWRLRPNFVSSLICALLDATPSGPLHENHHAMDNQRTSRNHNRTRRQPWVMLQHQRRIDQPSLTCRSPFLRFGSNPVFF